MQSLFSDFGPVDKKHWKEQVINDLKGKPYENLFWKLPEGITLEPYYTAKEVAALPATVAANLIPAATIPGAEPRQWVNLQYLAVTDATLAAANEQALLALNGGATGIFFDLRPLTKLPDFFVLLKDVQLQHCTLGFRVEEIGQQFMVAYLDYVAQMGLEPEQLQGFIAFDPLGYLSETGLMDNDRLKEWAETARTTLKYPRLRGVMLDSGVYHNAGADAVQEIAFLLSLSAEYLHRLTELGMEPEEAFHNIGFSVALGGRFFVEMAKLRALRLLITSMAHAYGLKDFKPADVYIHAYTGRWSKSRLDINTNLLRNTTEAMSGILGGCNALTVMPHTAVLGNIDAFSQRMARNISTILQEESYLGKVKDPVAGAYYPEVLTQKLQEASWKLFLSLEKEGAYSKLVTHGRLQELIEGSRRRRNQEVETRRQRIVGVNAYSNPAEELTLPASLSETDANGLLLRQLGQSDTFEMLRRRSQLFRQQHGRLPFACLLLYGDRASRSARAAFATDFMQTAGFLVQEIVLEEGEHPMGQLPSQLPDVLILCAADEDYNQQAGDIADQLRQGFAGILLVAGNPELLAAEVKHAALDGFIHLKLNAVSTLSEIQDKIFAHYEARL